MPTSRLISLHGGHSGEFCQHAGDRLADVVNAYERHGFSWVGLSEHMPPASDRFRYADERAAGLTARDLQSRFETYIAACRRLQKNHGADLKILVGFETETYTGAIEFARGLIEKYHPDYIVGSVHHVDDINFDFDRDHYERAVWALGNIDTLYGRYFDQQYEMITRLAPRVVGHFDLIRIFDPDYQERLRRPGITEKIDRNLSAIKQLGLILDLNMRALHKGAQEPYPARFILEKAREMKIPAVPGDDSHGVATVGNHIETGIRILEEMGFDTRWENILDKMMNVEHRTSNVQC